MNYKIVENIEDYIDEIIELDHSFYEDKYLWTKEYQLEIYKRNKNSFIAVELDKKLVGYLNFLSITKEKYNEMINSNIIVDDFDLNDIIPFSNNTYLTINSIVIMREHQNSQVIKLINNEFINKILKNPQINGINGFAVSPDGNKWFSYLNFRHLKKLNDGTDLYIK